MENGIGNQINRKSASGDLTDTLLLLHKKILLPFPFDPSGEFPEERDVVRLERLALQSHVSLFRCPVPFPVIAPDAGGNEVLPRILTTP